MPARPFLSPEKSLNVIRMLVRITVVMVMEQQFLSCKQNRAEGNCCKMLEQTNTSEFYGIG